MEEVGELPEIRRRGLVLGERGEDSETLGLGETALGVDNPVVVVVDARGGGGGGRRRARDVVVMAVAVVTWGFGSGFAIPEDIVLVELVSEDGACAGAGIIVGRRVGVRAEEALGGCGLLMADSGGSDYVHGGFSGQESKKGTL